MRISEFRDQAREVLDRYDHEQFMTTDAALDALEAILPTTIDRDEAIVAALDAMAAKDLYLGRIGAMSWTNHQVGEAVADSILALLRPDPRIAKLEALMDEARAALRRRGDDERIWTDAADALVAIEGALMILRGEDS